MNLPWYDIPKYHRELWEPHYTRLCDIPQDLADALELPLQVTARDLARGYLCYKKTLSHAATVKVVDVFVKYLHARPRKIHLYLKIYLKINDDIEEYFVEIDWTGIRIQDWSPEWTPMGEENEEGMEEKTERKKEGKTEEDNTSPAEAPPLPTLLLPVYKPVEFDEFSEELIERITNSWALPMSDKIDVEFVTQLLNYVHKRGGKRNSKRYSERNSESNDVTQNGNQADEHTGKQTKVEMTYEMYIIF